MQSETRFCADARRRRRCRRATPNADDADADADARRRCCPTPTVSVTPAPEAPPGPSHNPRTSHTPTHTNSPFPASSSPSKSGGPQPSAAAVIARGCRNTAVGPRRYADDQGLLCSAADLDSLSGCCLRATPQAAPAGADGAEAAADAADADADALATTSPCPASECDAGDACCSGYEPCVSCCMAPGNGASERAKRRLPAEGVDGARTGAQTGQGPFSDAFDFCSAVCRTHRRSTSHENSYVGARHHCFGRGHAVPRTEGDAVPAPLLRDVSVVLGKKGRSCDEACADAGARQAVAPLPPPLLGGAAAAAAPAAAAAAAEVVDDGQKEAAAATAAARGHTACSPERLRALDGSCDALRGVSDCEAGCDASGGRDASGLLGEGGHRRAARMAGAWPGYVDEGAAKTARPAMCVVNGRQPSAGEAGAGAGGGGGGGGGGGAAAPASARDYCAAKDKDVLRLCACVAP